MARKRKVTSDSSYQQFVIPIILVIVITAYVFIFASQKETQHNHQPPPSTISQTPTQQVLINTKQSHKNILLSISVKINGIGKGGNISPHHHKRTVIVYAYSVNSSAVIRTTSSLTYDGSNYFTGIINFGKVPQGAYLIKLTSPNTLQLLSKPKFQSLKNNQINTLSPITLYSGDINNANVLNVDDYNLILACFQNDNCTEPTIDFDDDGVVNILDYNLFLQSYKVLYNK